MGLVYSGKIIANNTNNYTSNKLKFTICNTYLLGKINSKNE